MPVSLFFGASGHCPGIVDEDLQPQRLLIVRLDEQRLYTAAGKAGDDVESQRCSSGTLWLAHKDQPPIAVLDDAPSPSGRVGMHQ